LIAGSANGWAGLGLWRGVFDRVGVCARGWGLGVLMEGVCICLDGGWARDVLDRCGCGDPAARLRAGKRRAWVGCARFGRVRAGGGRVFDPPACLRAGTPGAWRGVCARGSVIPITGVRAGGVLLVACDQ
jgi:hypothetical protein